MQSLAQCCRSRRCWILAGAVFAWCVMFPEDLTMLVTPIATASNAVTPWLYGLAAVALVCSTYRSVHATRVTSA